MMQRTVEPRPTLFRTYSLPALGFGSIQVTPSSPFRQRVVAFVNDPVNAALLTTESGNLEQPGGLAYLAGPPGAFFVRTPPAGTSPLSFSIEPNDALFAVASTPVAPVVLLHVIIYPSYFDFCDVE